MKQTTNYLMHLPEVSDYVDIDVLNENTVKIDGELKKTETHRGEGTSHVTPAEKESWNGKAERQHSHPAGDITGLDTAIAGKADKLVPAAVGNLAALDAAGNLLDTGKQSGDFAAAGHSHSMGDITAGTLPIDRGGTGAGTAAAARGNLGIWGKGECIDDDTCTILDIPITSTPNDALQKIIMSAGKYVFGITVQYEDGTPAAGLTVSGLTKMNGGGAVTDETGYVLGFAATASANLSVSTPYLDINSWSQPVTSTKPITKATAVLTKKTATNVQHASSTSFRFSHLVTGFDVTLVGGGGAGGSGYIATDTGSYTGGNGGGGGYVSAQSIASVLQNDIFSVEIGSGGTAGANATSGGASTFKKNGTVLLSALGGDSGAAGGNGNGGKGNGHGGWGAKAGSGGHYASEGGAGSGGYGGGGGGGNDTRTDGVDSPKWGGSPYGGSGGYAFSTAGPTYIRPANPGHGPGGGGGGGYRDGYPGGDGYRGAAVISWRYKA